MCDDAVTSCRQNSPVIRLLELLSIEVTSCYEVFDKLLVIHFYFYFYLATDRVIAHDNLRYVSHLVAGPITRWQTSVIADDVLWILKVGPPELSVEPIEPLVP